MYLGPRRYHPFRIWAGCLFCCLLPCGLPSTLGAAPGLAQELQQLEWSGDLAGARSLLERSGSSPEAAEETARFLDRHADSGRRQGYLKWAAVETDPARKQVALRQVVLLDVLEGRHNDLQSDLEQYRNAGGSDFSPKDNVKAPPYSAVLIPGPLSSFARMAALSPDLAPEDLLPALARNLTTNGFEAAGNELLQPTEYLRLLIRYVGQARELQALANADHKIVVPACDSEQTGNLLKVLGYRMRGSCGSDLVLETVNPTRAFLTDDSGFPLTQLEQDLRGNRRFEVPYAPTKVPILYDTNYWMGAAGNHANSGEFLDALMSEPALCRLYLGLSHLDHGVAEVLRRQMPPGKLRLYANVLDFYGGMLKIENGSVMVPGSPRVWAGIVGAQPSNPGVFLEKILTTDDGWLMSYYDALMRMSDGPVYNYLTQPERLKRFYDALRGKITTPGPARPVFRSSTDLLIFTTSLWAEPNGVPHIPGNLEVWRTLFIKHPHGKYDGRLTRSAATWKTSDDLLEALFALSRKTADNEPLHIFLSLNDIDRNRTHPISPEITARLIGSFNTLNAQYNVFASVPRISERTIGSYLDICRQITRDNTAKADRAGSLQALVELWVVLSRQNSIPPANQDSVFASLLAPWSDTATAVDIFGASRAGLETLLNAVEPKSAGATIQEKWVTLLTGALRQDDSLPASPAALFWKYFDAQQLIPLDAIFSAADHLGKGPLDPKVAKIFNDRLERLDESNQMHEAMSRDEKAAVVLGYWTEKHIEAERKFSLEAAGKTGEKKDVRAALEPFLRDTLVGMLYCYYEPAGAQILLTNPLFVRMHDFTGSESAPVLWRTTEVSSMGWPTNSGGRLAGSMAGLSYALAQAEQNFLSPRKEQALIWADLVPQLIINVTVPRWRNIAPEQLRWVSLHIRRGRNLMAAAALSPEVEQAVTTSLSRFVTPANIERIEEDLYNGRPERAIAQLPPSYLYALGSDPKLASVSPDVTTSEIAALTATGSPTLSATAISRAFGTPKLTLTHTLTPELMYLRTFPTLMGYSSRLMAESWESNNLFYAALADQAGVRATDLDALVPEWNRTAIENIFATHLEDWPALIRSLNLTADGVLHHNTEEAVISTPGN